MVQNSRGGFRKSTPFYDVELKRTDTYSFVISKACETISIVESDDLRLLTARGSVIPDKGRWTLSGYLSKRHISADKLSLGIGSETRENHEDVINTRKRQITEGLYIGFAIQTY